MSKIRINIHNIDIWCSIKTTKHKKSKNVWTIAFVILPTLEYHFDKHVGSRIHAIGFGWLFFLTSVSFAYDVYQYK
jgi:hypothetical protein